MTRAILATLLAVYATAQSPTNNRPKKVLTPEQLAYQKEMKDHRKKLDKLRADAAAPYSAELTREKIPLCPDANNTRDLNMCLVHEIELTNTNYKAFTSAIHAMLALPEPGSPGVSTPIIGPTGPEATPATSMAAFDAAESAWQAYAKAECSAMDTLWRGGTIVNSIVGECELRMVRDRMRELDTAYEMELHQH
jgi:uncharacterized protein YecT (DUF1311 family)